MIKKSVILLVGMLVCGSAMTVSAQVPALHMDETQDEGNTSTDSLYQKAENDLFSVEFPKKWKVEYSEYDIAAGKTAANEIPFIEVLPVTLERSVDEELIAWSDMVKERYQQRLTGEPDRVEYRVSGTDRVVEGIKFSVSSEDGVNTYTYFMTLEEVDGIYITYFCTYLSGSYDENQHEDETTYFEFLHVIDTMTMK